MERFVREQIDRWINADATAIVAWAADLQLQSSVGRNDLANKSLTELEYVVDSIQQLFRMRDAL